MNYLLSLIADLKLPAVIKWIDEFLEQNPTEKLVVFGHHRKFLDALHAHYSDKSVLVYGKIKGKKRQDRINAFVDESHIRIFFGGIMAAGTGINRLQEASKVIAITELIWNPKKLEQVEGRLHRMGQKDNVLAFYLITKDTAETILCKSIFTKSENIDAIVDGKFRKGANEFSIFKRVVNALERKRRKR
jgi:SNF2 family DNA or RNA helicase